MSIASICPIEFSVGKQDGKRPLYPPKVFFLKCNPVKNLRGEEGTVGHKLFVVLILSASSTKECSTILVFSSFPTTYRKRMTMKEYKRQYRELNDETKEKIAASQRGRTKSHTAICVDCGHSWKDGKPSKCPNCGAVLNYADDSRQRKFYERPYYCIVQKVREFSVIRCFYIQDTIYLGRHTRETVFTEIYQHWIDESGKDTIRALTAAMFPYYRYCPFSLNSDLSIKRDRGRYGYRNAYYHSIPDAYYPRMSCSPLLKRNGFKKQFYKFYPEDVFSALLSDNKFETLWKLGRFDLAERYLDRDRERITKYWKALLRCPVMDTTILLDYMDLLEYFGRNPNSIYYPTGPEIIAEHDRLMRRKEAILEQQRLEEVRKNQREKLAILESKSKYFGITFGNERMVVIVLASLEDYRNEGKLQHHCVYANAYYGKKDSLVLSARMRDRPDKPVETVEISLKDGKILQCFGPCNSHTEYHQEILDLVNGNAKLFLRA